MIIKSELITQNPLVSVIITSYNRYHTIGQTIESVLNQKCDFEYEIIVGDDGSSDNSRDLLRDYSNKYPEKFLLLFHHDNLGLGGNWASCVKLARGKYIATCDDDDFWHNNNKLAIQVKHLEDSPDTVMVHTEINYLNAKSNILLENVYRTKNIHIIQGKIQKEIFNGKVQICISSSLIRKQTIDSYVNLDDYIRLKFTIQDWPTWVIISKYGNIDFLDTSTCTYRVGHYAISNFNDYDKQLNKLSKDRIMYEYLCELFSKELTCKRDDFEIYKYNVLLSLAIRKRDYKNANLFSSELKKIGVINLKSFIASNLLLFILYIIIHRIKSFFKYN